MMVEISCPAFIEGQVLILVRAAAPAKPQDLGTYIWRMSRTPEARVLLKTPTKLPDVALGQQIPDVVRIA